ncbi:MAG TPA: mannonate dehydratase [Rhizomicrobium sp.]|nr:mannonate dehydratase [Rhizomicrobium sp.]
MDRRDFGKALAAGAMGATALGADAAPSSAKTHSGAASDVPYRVLPDLKVRRLGDIHTGGDYHTLVGKGPTDPASLNYFRRFNARYLTVRARTNATPEEMAQWPHAGVFLNADGPWDGDELMRWQDNCRAADMTMEAVRMDSAYIIMKEGPQREKYLDLIRDNIRKASRAGVKLVSYHWTMIPIRRNFTVTGRGDSIYDGFKLEPDYKSLPPTEAAGRVSLDEYWERIDHFLKGVVPAAREAKVKLAVHPYDPGGLPLGYQGVDNWDAVHYMDAIRKYLSLYDDPYNGLCYECGVTGESTPDTNAQLPFLREMSERGRIVQVHFRNIRGGQGDFVEVYEDEGDTDMLNLVRVLRDTGWEGTLLPDHNPRHADDPKKLEAFAFSYGYIEGLLRSARKEGIRATKV